jgi:hypothetical protein
MNIGQILAMAFRYTVRFLVSVVVGSCAAITCSLLLPEFSPPQTDRMGYAIVYNFDPNHLWWISVIWMIILPVVALGTYVLIPRVAPRLKFLKPLVGHESDSKNLRIWRTYSDQAHTSAPPVFGVLRSAIVAFTLLVAFVVSRPVAPKNIWLLLVVGSLIGGLTPWIIERIVVRLSGATETPSTTRTIRSTLTIVATWLSLPALWYVSHKTTVFVASENTTRSLAWLPLYVVLIPTALLIAFDIRRLLRRQPAVITTLERARITFLIVPVLLFLFTSQAPGDVAKLDIFHHGESLTGALRWQSGQLPWKDFFFNVGLLPAVIVPRISFELFGTSFWGLVAGTELIFIPLLIVSLYLCSAVFTKNNVAFLSLVSLFFFFPQKFMWGFAEVLRGDPTLFIFRYIPLALLGIPILWFFTKRSWISALVLAASLVTSIILSPEMIVYLASVGLVAVVIDLYDWRDGNKPWSLRSLTLRVASCGVSSVIAAGIILNQAGVLSGFISWWQTFPAKWYLETAVPLNVDADNYQTPTAILVITPILVLIVSFFLIWRFRTRKTMSSQDWTIVALALGGALFFRKTTNRPDSHVYQSLIAMLPVLIYVIQRGGELLGDLVQPFRNAGSRIRASAWVWLFIGPLLLLPGAPLINAVDQTVTSLPSRLHARANAPATIPRLGYYSDANYVNRVAALRAFFKENIGKDARIYDFSNSSSLYSFLLNKVPATQFSYVLQSATSKSQAQVIDSMRQQRPEVVIYASAGGLNEWDHVENAVRHYDISEYILRNYSPWIDYLGQTMLIRNDLAPGEGLALTAPARVSVSESRRMLRNSFDIPTPESADAVVTCNWGHAGQYMSTRPDLAGTPITRTEVTGVLTLTGWAPSLGKTPTTIVVSQNGKVIHIGTTTQPRGDLGVSISATGPKPGFWFEIPLTDPDATDSKIAIFAVQDDTLIPLTRLSGKAPLLKSLTVNGVDMNVITPVAGQVTGEFVPPKINISENGRILIGFRGEPKYLTLLDLPTNFTEFSWMVLSSKSGFSENKHILYDESLDARRAISFYTAKGGHIGGAQVASCPTWFGWETQKVLLQSDAPLGDVSIELVKIKENS